jgi:hypothetical protein
LFEGLVVDETERPVAVKLVGDQAFYVVDDDGFLRHIESEDIDRQVVEHLVEMIRGNEDVIARGTMEMIGQDDIFTKAAIESSLHQAPEHTDLLLQQGLPEEARLWLGMLGFRVVIDLHGTVVRIDQPQAAGPTDSPEKRNSSDESPTRSLYNAVIAPPEC